MSFYLKCQGKPFDSAEELIVFLYNEEALARACLLECTTSGPFTDWIRSLSNHDPVLIWNEETSHSADPDISIARCLYLLELAAPDLKRRILYICKCLLQDLPEFWLMNNTALYQTRTAGDRELLKQCQTFSQRTAKSSKDYLGLVTELKDWHSSIQNRLLNCYPLYENHSFLPTDTRIFITHMNGYLVHDQEGRSCPIGYLREKKDPASQAALIAGIRNHTDRAATELGGWVTSAHVIQEKGKGLQDTIRKNYPPGGIFSHLFSILYIVLSVSAAATVLPVLPWIKASGSMLFYLALLLLFASVLCIQSSVKRILRRKKWNQLTDCIRETERIQKKTGQILASLKSEAEGWEKKGALTPKGICYQPVLKQLESQIASLEPSLKKKNYTKTCFLLVLMAWLSFLALGWRLEEAASSSHTNTPAPSSVNYHYTSSTGSFIDEMTPVTPAYAEASSTLISSRGLSYEPSMAIDGDLSTSWQEGSEGSGEGEWIRIGFDEPVSVRTVAMNLGNWSSSDKYSENCRPSVITLAIEADGSEWGRIPLEPADVMDRHSVSFDTAVQCTSLCFYIDGVYEGSKYTDMVISELQVYQ